MPAAEICTSRPIAVRRRTDLVTSLQLQRGERVYVVKDPLALKYFRFSDAEHAVLKMLDRPATLADIARSLAREFPDVPIDVDEIKAFINSLYASGLVVSDAPEEGARLLKRRNAQRRQRLRGLATSVLSIRTPGIDPTWLLDAIEPWTSWFFGRRAMVGVALLASFALVLLATHAATLPGELVAMHGHFGSGNWLLLALTFAVTKMLHELGHALACRRCGGECREIGVTFLVLTPCLYCDVSDSWMLPSRWQRAAIAAAGMYVEVTLAAIATIVWSQSEPGTLHYLALQVILVCSVSTLLFNGNPLARYDGYYILADLVEIPNLREEARAALKSRLFLLVGIERRDAAPNASWKLALFGLATALYRWLLLGTILWGLHHILAARGLEVAWQCLAATVLFSVVVVPAWRLLRALRRKEVGQAVDRRRLLIVLAIAFSAAACFVLVPLPRNVGCTFQTRYADAMQICAPHAGSLERVYAEQHRRVHQGEPIAELRSIDLDLEISRLSAELKSHQSQLRSLQFERFQNPQAVELIGQTEKVLAAAREQLAERIADRAQLRLVAPRDGVVLPPPRRPTPRGPAALATWSGAPLDARNRGTPLAPGDVVCEVADPDRLEAVLLVDEADVEFLAPGQSVELIFDAQSLQRHRGRIAEIALHKVEAIPPGLSVQAGGQVASRMDSAGVERPASPAYSVVVPLDAGGIPPAAGIRGAARIDTGRETLASGAWRYLCHTFRFAW